MTTLIHCPTDTAILMLAIKRDDGLIVVPTQSEVIPGIVSVINPSLPINPQLMDMAFKRTGIPRIEISVWQEFQDTIHMEDGSPATVYAARSLVMPREPIADVKSLPDILRAMPQNRNRVAYMKVLQVFSGALEEQTKALDLEEVRKHIKGLSKDSDL